MAPTAFFSATAQKGTSVEPHFSTLTAYGVHSLKRRKTLTFLYHRIYLNIISLKPLFCKHFIYIFQILGNNIKKLKFKVILCVVKVL